MDRKEMDRKELERRLRALNDPWQCAAFAAKMSLLALPALAAGMGEEQEEKVLGLFKRKTRKPFLWFWREPERETHLLAVLRAGQLAWSAALLQDREIAAAAARAAYTTAARTRAAAASLPLS